MANNDDGDGDGDDDDDDGNINNKRVEDINIEAC